MGAKFRDRFGSFLMLAFLISLWVQRGYNTIFGGIFPDAIMIIMAVIIVVTLILSFTPYRAMPEGDKKASKATTGERWLDMTVVIGIMLLWVLLLRYLGFALCGVVGYASIAWYISREWKNWKVIANSVVAGLAITYMIIFIFGHLLKVPLPQGQMFG